MKIEQYFPFEVNMINSEKVAELIEVYGPKGFGIYVMILIELRHSPNYRCGLNAIKAIARRCKIGNTLLMKVLGDFGLFEIEGQTNNTTISSPYLDRVMGAYDERLSKLAEAGKKGYDKSKRKSNGQFTANGGALDKIREEEIKEDKNTSMTTISKEEEKSVEAKTLVVDDGESVIDRNAETILHKTWEECLEQAIKDEIWVEQLAMSSGMSKLFVKHRELVIELFRQHVLLQGGRPNIRTEQEIKAYFANFLRPGTPTQKRVAEQLCEREREIAKTSPYRFETIDPETGERSYYGNPIPAQAPPRPNDNAVWSPKVNEWI